jgi:ParB family chromosome partitioning protein
MGKDENKYEAKEIALADIELLPLFAMRDLKEADIDSLAESIKAEGLLTPLIVRPKGKGYELVAGHRRYMALKKLGWKTVPARIAALDDQRAFVVAMTENLERKDPTPMEEATAFKRAVDDLHLKVETIAGMMNRSPSLIHNRIRLLDLHPKVIKALEDGTVKPDHCDKGFFKLKNQEDQLQLLVDIQDGFTISDPDDLKGRTNELAHSRKQIDALAEYLEANKVMVKYPKCPSCGEAPDPEGYMTDIKKDILTCSNCHNVWNAIKGPIKARETTLDGGISGRSSTPGGENVVKVEAAGHRSNLDIMQFFAKINELVTKAKAVKKIRIEEEYGEDLEIHVHVTKKDLPMLPRMTAEAKAYQKSDHKTHIDVGIGNWGGDNKGTLKDREKLWALERLVDPKAEPAEIIRVSLERLVIDHKAISKGTELANKNGTYKVHAVHRDYTATLTDPAGRTKLFEEDELRGIVKGSKKAAKKGGG